MTAPTLLSSLPPELRLIGGLAVMCRVGTPHRATVDLDASDEAGVAVITVTSVGQL